MSDALQLNLQSWAVRHKLGFTLGISITEYELGFGTYYLRFFPDLYGTCRKYNHNQEDLPKNWIAV